MTNTAMRAKRGPYAPTVKRRKLIASAVLELIDEVGPESFTTAQVAQRSSTPEATVLYHFPSRDDLLVGALALADERGAEQEHVDDPVLRIDLDRFTQLYRPPSSTDPRYRLNRLVRGLASTPGTAASEYMRDRTRRQVEIFTRIFEQRREDGLAHPDADARSLARQVIALWEGLETLFADDADADVPQLLNDAIRRLSGESWVQMHRALGDVDRSF